MAISYGFYNSIQHDRKYNAVQMSQIFDGIINDGIYMGFKDHFAVSPGSGMKVIVGSGRAWFNHTWTYNDSALIVDLDPASAGLNRIDLIALVVDISDEVRANSIQVIKGDPIGSTPVKPVVEDTDTKFYHPLAYVTISASTTQITAGMIENCIGADHRTPFVTGIIETIDATELIASWGAEWEDYKIATRTDYERWIAKQKNDMIAWETTFKNDMLIWQRDKDAEVIAWERARNREFNAWFDNVKGQLSTDPAGHLQNEIDALIFAMFENENSMHNKHTHLNRNDDGDIVQVVATNLDTGAVLTTDISEDAEGHNLIHDTLVYDGHTYEKDTLVNMDTDDIYETVL